MNIRKYQAKDRENLRRICVETAHGALSEKKRTLLPILYNDYYTEYEPEHVFVLTDDEDNAVGYIIAAADYAVYEQIFKEVYLPIVKKISFTAYFVRRLQMITDKKFAKKYPAHLHIDILDGYTGQGEGTRLMNQLFLTLQSEGVKGICLGVGAKNHKAIRFYQRHGFQKIAKLTGAIFMGLEFPSR